VTSPLELDLGRRRLPALVADLRESGVRFNAYAEALLGQVHVARPPQRVQVVVRTVGDLGWPHGATLDEVLRNAAHRGLAPCPLEVALHLRLAWRETAVVPRVTVLSERAHPDESRPRGFYLRDDDEGCWLRGYVASDDWIAEPTERLALISSLPRPR